MIASYQGQTYLAEEGKGFIQLMQQLPQERLSLAQGAVVETERALAMTLDFVKQRKAFGQRILDFQNTKFKLAECKTEALIGRTFVDQCLIKHLDGNLDSSTASMAKYWCTTSKIKLSMYAFKCMAALALWTSMKSQECTEMREYKRSMAELTK